MQTIPNLAFIRTDKEQPQRSKEQVHDAGFNGSIYTILYLGAHSIKLEPSLLWTGGVCSQGRIVIVAHVIVVVDVKWWWVSRVGVVKCGMWWWRRGSPCPPLLRAGPHQATKAKCN